MAIYLSRHISIDTKCPGEAPLIAKQGFYLCNNKLQELRGSKKIPLKFVELALVACHRCLATYEIVPISMKSVDFLGYEDLSKKNPVWISKHHH